MKNIKRLNKLKKRASKIQAWIFSYYGAYREYIKYPKYLLSYKNTPILKTVDLNDVELVIKCLEKLP